MSTNPYPVDSATRTCCGGIGTHTRTCSTEPAAPAGASVIDDWGSGGEDRRVILGHDRHVIDSDVFVSTACIQHRDGRIDDGTTGDEGPSVYLDGAPASLNSDQARILAALLLESAALIDGWVRR
ncbi:hypothetical protein [Mycolicibacterium austroafricanum]|uniref:hypothetical protein n=1 Tax=Mycolicibacterium austroafricanum TaxID=39687 RepID=UPI001CA36AA5|nr:hypothetical protein [Mycolicibacterium austroafricanum]QZT54600.1 hypothetical protein JN084_16240 [Mycolicibacterium austroafricanum]